MRLVCLLALAYLALVPAALLGVPLPNHDSARIAQVGLGAIASACTGWWLVRLRTLSVPKVTALGAVLAAVLGVASVAQAARPDMALREVALYIGMACVAVAIAVSPAAGRLSSIGTLIASSAYASLIVLVALIALLQGQPLQRSDLFIGFDNYRFYNHVQTVALPLLLVAASESSFGPGIRRIAAAALSVGIALLIYTLGRGTIVGLLTSFAVALVLFGSPAWSLLKRLGWCALAGGGLYVALFVVAPTTANGLAAGGVNDQFATMGADNSRFMLWRLALDYCENSPLLGIGPMHYAHHPNGKAAHPHNAFLQLAAEWGLPMLCLAIIAAGIFFIRLTKTIRLCKRPEAQRIGIGLFVASTALLVDGAFSAAFAMPVPQVWTAALFGWTTAWLLENARGQRVSGVTVSLPARLFLALAIVVLQLWMLFQLWPEVRDLNDHLLRVADKVPGPKLNPRFWSHGWF